MGYLPPPLFFFPLTFHLWSRLSMNKHTKLTNIQRHICTSKNISLHDLQLNNKSQKRKRFPPSVHISPDSRSSELERRSRSYDRDRSRSLPLALSVEGDVSLSSQTLWSALSSRHFSWDGEGSLSRVWDDLSLKEMRKKKKITTCRVFKVKFYHFFLQSVSRLKGEPLPPMPMRMGVRAVPLLVPVFPLSLSFSAFFSGMRGMVTPWTMGGWTAAIPDKKKKRKQVSSDRSHLSMFM